MQNVAVFDFDGTLYKKDSLIEFCKFTYLRMPWRIIFVPVQIFALILHRFKLIDTTKFKELFLLYLLGLNKKKQSLVEAFWQKEFPQNFNFEVLNLIDQKQASHIICLTASPDFMFKNIIQKLNLTQCISTRTLSKKGVIKIIGKNCRGKEKIERLKKAFPYGYNLVFAISDNPDDYHLLLSAKKAYKITKHKIKLFK